MEKRLVGVEDVMHKQFRLAQMLEVCTATSATKLYKLCAA